MENSAVRKPDRVISFGAPAGSWTGLWLVMGIPDKSADEMLFLYRLEGFLGDNLYTFLAGIFFVRAPPRMPWFYTPCPCALPAEKKGNFAKYKSPKYFDSDQSGLFMNNCAFHDGTLC